VLRYTELSGTMGKDHLPDPLKKILYRQLTVVVLGSAAIGTTFKAWQHYSTAREDERLRAIRTRQAEHEAKIPNRLLSAGEFKRELEKLGYDMSFIEAEDEEGEEASE
jgi:hypothetical protein